MGWMSRLLPWRRPARTRAEASPSAQADACVHEQALPALEAVRATLTDEGYETTLDRGEDWVELRATNFNGLPLKYAVRGHVYRRPSVNLASMRSEDGAERFARIEIESGGRRRQFRPAQCSRETIERDALRYYRRFLMHSAPGWYG